MLDEMLLGVIVFNTAIATACFWATWRLLRLRLVVQEWTAALELLETDLQQNLTQVPRRVQHNRQQLRKSREQYGLLQFRVSQYLKWTQQALALTQWGIARWQGSGNLSRKASE